MEAPETTARPRGGRSAIKLLDPSGASCCRGPRRTAAAETDLDGRYILVNDTYCALTGRSRDELLATDKVEVTHVESRAATRAAIARVCATGQPATLEKRYLHPDGETMWVSNTISPV